VKSQSLLAHLLGRLEKSVLLDNIVVGTAEGNGEIEDEVEGLGFDCIVPDRDEDDVLGRYLDIARSYEADVIVRITGDCPLIDADIVDNTVNILGAYDMATNVWPRTYPQGLDVEVMPYYTLERLDSMLEEGHPDREHVCVHVYENPLFDIVSLVEEDNNSHLRWCVDDEVDFDIVADILRKCGDLSYREILRCITN